MMPDDISIKKFPGIICVSENDLQYLFKYALKACLKFTDFLSEIYIVTPSVKNAESIISEIVDSADPSVVVVCDSELLSKAEVKMCGWSKQQILKLRSHKLTKSTETLSFGADTILLSELALERLYSHKYRVVNYRNHQFLNKHLQFEINRVINIFHLFELDIANQEDHLRDFIFDIFLFNSYLLEELNDFLHKKFGYDYFKKIFPHNIAGYQDMEKIGEWSLYTIFLIKILRCPYVFQDATDFVHQVHSQKELTKYKYQDNAVHLVRKDFNSNEIFQQLKRRRIL